MKLMVRKRGSGVPLFLFVKDNSSKVYDFRSSRFNSKHSKCSRLLSFHHEKLEYKVGDFVSIHGDDENIYQIQAIGYTKNNNLPPDLHFVSTVFLKAYVFYLEHPRICKRGRPQSNEYIQMDEKKKFKPRDIEEKIDLMPFGESKDDALVCRYSFRGDSLQLYVPMRVNFCDDFIEHGK